MKRLGIIVGPPGGHAVLDGTAGDDTIIARGQFNIVNGLGGNDSVLALGGHNTIYLGSASDIAGQVDQVGLGGADNSVTGLGASVFLTGAASGTAVRLGGGNNRVLLDGAGNTISCGSGSNMVSALGGAATVTLGEQTTSQIVATNSVTVNGQHDVVRIGNYAGKYPDPGSGMVQGGSGYGTFTLAGETGSVSTGGLHNVIDIIDGEMMSVVAGSGFDTVLLDVSQAAPRDVHVQLAGLGNVVTGVARTAVIAGGSGQGTFILGGVISFGSSNTIVTHGPGNVISLTAAVSTVAAGSGNDSVTLQGGTATVAFAGSGDMLFLNPLAPNEPPAQYGAVAHVVGQASDLSFYIEPGLNSLVIDDFGSGDVIHLLKGAGGYGTAQQAYAALRPDGIGGYSLSVDQGTIHIDSAHHLSVSSFSIG